jgi:hypothetical protein
VQPLFISYCSKIYIVNEDAKSAKPWYFCDFHDDIYELAADPALELITSQGDYSRRSAAQNFFVQSTQRKIFLVKQCAANSGVFRIA